MKRLIAKLFERNIKYVVQERKMDGTLTKMWISGNGWWITIPASFFNESSFFKHG